MGLRFAEQRYGSCFFVTTSFQNHAAYGTIPGVYETLIDSLGYYSEKYEAKYPAFVLMPTHIHLLILINGKRLSGFMRDFKKFVAQRSMINLGILEKPIWQRGYDRQAIYSEKVFRIKVKYVHHNPVKAGLVRHTHDWKWSSAKAYTGDAEGPLNVWTDWVF